MFLKSFVKCSDSVSNVLHIDNLFYSPEDDTL